jgi:hypothetical protein
MVGPNVGLSCEMVRNGSRGRVSTAVDAVFAGERLLGGLEPGHLWRQRHAGVVNRRVWVWVSRVVCCSRPAGPTRVTWWIRPSSRLRLRQVAPGASLNHPDQQQCQPATAAHERDPLVKVMVDRSQVEHGLHRPERPLGLHQVRVAQRDVLTGRVRVRGSCYRPRTTTGGGNGTNPQLRRHTTARESAEEPTRCSAGAGPVRPTCRCTGGEVPEDRSHAGTLRQPLHLIVRAFTHGRTLCGRWVRPIYRPYGPTC